MQAVIPHSPEFARLQRQYFLTCEKYLDAGTGFTPFTDPDLCALFRAGLERLEIEQQWTTPHWVVMPNHVHLLLQANTAAAPLRRAIPLLKGRFARAANRRLAHCGAFWQREWFDHWVRDDAELDRIVEYIRANPVKAGMVKTWSEYPWLR